MKNKFIPFAKPLLGKEEKLVSRKILDGTTLTHGPNCRRFEKAFGRMHKNTTAVTLSNCTSAMFLALKTMKIGINDEVIVPAMTHIATAHCVAHTGAKPIFCDIDPNTGNINHNIIPKIITKKTKAIIVVHFIGLPANMEAINKIANDKSLFVVEDCAAALGAKYNKKIVGTLSDAGCYSFYHTKHITTMEGGMLISRSKKIVDKVRKLSSFGYNKTLQERSIPGVYDVDLLGYNLRMNEVAAGIGVEQLKKLSKFIKSRKTNAKKIKALLSKKKGFKILPSTYGKSESSDFCVNIILDNKYSKFRNKLLIELKSKNLGTSVHYPVCLPFSKFYKKFAKKNKEKSSKFPVANQFAKCIISLPCGPHLTKDDVNNVANIFIDSFRKITK